MLHNLFNEFISLFFVVFVLVILYFLKKYFNGGVCNVSRNLKDLVIIITGSNIGLGKQVALNLSYLNPTIILACRNLEKATETSKYIISHSKNLNIIPMHLDLSDFDSIINFSNEFKKKFKRLDILINNAGVCLLNKNLNKDGVEMTMATNVIGPYLLTNYLIDILKNSPKSRIINLSSVSHKLAKSSDFDLENLNSDKYYEIGQVYHKTKLANIYLTQEIAEKYNDCNFKCVSIHPGIIFTNILSEFSSIKWIKFLILIFYPLILFCLKPIWYGIQTYLYVVFEDYDKLKNGKYYADCKLEETFYESHNLENRKKLIKYIENLLIKKGIYKF